ncbi:DUF2339 domain-containing protein [Phaeobacter sp. PT47_59]|uniref:DUF2339 domain-containing protein n=1 Tax=Phaeobacter sp. PT47_59 TaxID=3029979 RepID=UPI0023802369|nr:DUF2339 domain-containing protein [Phaeobacter sp. PT47_59]MDE4172741.1 DUF2339 domain-containing protein [Phaeobacter sp. PT47_59]
MTVFPLIILLIIVFIIAAPIYLRILLRKQEDRLDALERRLSEALDELALGTGSPPARMQPDTEQTVVKPAADHIDAATEDAEMSDQQEQRREAVPAAEAQSEGPAAEETSRTPAGGNTPWGITRSQPPEDPVDVPGRSLEETLASQWLIWVGAIAVALSAVFLFRYAVDQGWLTPMTRVILGLLLGGALLAAGEWAMRNPVKAVERAVNPDYVPPALSGSGIFAVFVSLYAAHGIFGLLTPTTGFVALALTSYAALLLSLRQGAFVALLGLVAGYLVPALVDTPVPQAMPLFLYLFVLTAGCLLVMVWRKWWWFSYLALTGALVWPVLWLEGSWTLGDQGVLSSYALGLALLFALLSTGLPIKRPETPLWRWAVKMLADTSGLGFALSGLLLLAVAAATGFNGAGFAFIGAYGAAALLMATRRAALESLLLASATITLAAVLLWPTPVEVTPAIAAQDLPDRGFGPFLVPPEYRVYAHALWTFAALFGVGGFIGMRWGRSKAVWAGIANLMPLLFFVIGYWRIGGLETDVAWALIGGALALLAVAAAVRTGRWVDHGPGSDLATALFAAGATAALALAFTCLLREAWLTVALGFETLALAWIWSRVRLQPLRTIAALVTLVVIARLALNPMILDYEGDVFGLFGWVIYGYGLPAVASLVAARLFGGSPTDPTRTLCEIAAAGFAFLMVALQFKLWTSGDLSPANWALFDQSVQVIWWLVAAGLLLFEARRGQRRWPYPAGMGLLLLALVTIFFGAVLSLSPLLTGEPVGRLPLLNLLALAYLVPAILLLVIGRSSQFRVTDRLRRLLPGAAGGLLFLYITLETRRAFWGSVIALSDTTQPSNLEFYAYSAVWILFALCLLAIGILRVSVPLRYASLAVLLITVAKVFLFDMSDLTGLFRVASFLGLGLALIGIGRIYQRYVFRPEQTGPEDETA